MSPRPPVDRRLLWTLLPAVLVVGALSWFLRTTPDENGREPDAGAQTPSASASSPGADPSSGPTGTPSPGSLEEVPVDEVTPLPSVPLTATADVGQGLTLRIARVERVEGVARGVGEIAGPALRLTLELTNASDDEVSVDSAVVDLLAGQARTPAATLTGPGARTFEGDVAPGTSETGVYVFGLAPEERERVRVSVSYQSGAPVAVFTGSLG